MAENAVQSNIKTKGERAYYYAHSREWNDTDAIVTEGEGIITGGPPVLLAREDSKTAPNISAQKITKYSWMDDGKSVKVILEFDHEISEEMI